MLIHLFLVYLSIKLASFLTYRLYHKHPSSIELTTWSRYQQNSVFCAPRCKAVIHTQTANKMRQCTKIYYFMSIWSSTCFGRHTAHHQELKTALAASAGGWTLTASSNHNVQRPSTYANSEAGSAVLSSWWWAVCRPKHVDLHINIKY
jgi:hypothetical protein